jgi:hypothetical protein
MSNYRLKLQNPECDPGFVIGQSQAAPRPRCICDTPQHKFCRCHFEFEPTGNYQLSGLEVNYTVSFSEDKGSFTLDISDVKVTGQLFVDYQNDCYDLQTIEHDLSTFEVNFEPQTNPFGGFVQPVINEIDLAERMICITF